MRSGKRYILPIFLLYTITSTLFLAFFSISYYKEAKKDIFKQSKKEIKGYADKIEYMLRANDDYKDILQTNRNYEVNLYSKKAKKFLLKEFDRPKVKFYDDFYINKDFIYYSDDIHDRRKAVKLYIDLRVPSPVNLINKLLLKISMISIIVLIAIFVIAYFIVKLSYIPLLNQIRTLNNFIADTTHEINTPLSVILMSVEMFEKNPSKYIENIKIASNTLSNLYNDLSLNLKSEPNSITNLNLKDIFFERTKIFEMSAAKKGIKIDLETQKVIINSDILKFKKILDNLLSNAVKYSFKDEKIMIRLDQNGFSVTNKGETISKENLNNIYDKFTRFDTQNGGFGIGLSLVKRYCEELGFKIYCKSKDNITEFYLKFNNND